MELKFKLLTTGRGFGHLGANHTFEWTSLTTFITSGRISIAGRLKKRDSCRGLGLRGDILMFSHLMPYGWGPKQGDLYKETEGIH